MSNFKSKIKFTTQEWIDAIACCSNKGTGMSARDLADIWGVAVATAQTRVTELFRQGKIFCSGRKMVPNVDGRTHVVPVYSLVKKGKK